MSSPFAPLCFTWSDVEKHKPLIPHRITTLTDFAWLLLASRPDVTVVYIDDSPGTVSVRLNRGADLKTAAKLLNKHRSIDVVVKVGYMPAMKER